MLLFNLNDSLSNVINSINNKGTLIANEKGTFTVDDLSQYKLFWLGYKSSDTNVIEGSSLIPYELFRQNFQIEAIYKANDYYNVTAKYLSDTSVEIGGNGSPLFYGIK